MTTKHDTAVRAATAWLSIQHAADLLDMTPAALRRALERRATRTPDGGTEALLDGLRGRKLGSLWKVQLGEAWATPSTPSVVTRERRGRVRSGPGDRP